MNEIVKIRPYVPEDWDKLVTNAKADNHSGVYFPTDIFVKNDEIVFLLQGFRPFGIKRWHEVRAKDVNVFVFKAFGFVNGCENGARGTIAEALEQSKQLIRGL